MTTEIRHSAITAGWPQDIAMSLSVVFEDGQLRIDYPESMQEKIHDAEYGTPSNPPASVLRSFMYRCDKYIENVLNGEIVDELMVEGDIF